MIEQAKLINSTQYQIFKSLQITCKEKLGNIGDHNEEVRDDVPDDDSFAENVIVGGQHD